MENEVLPSSAVADEIQRRFIEIRLHCDQGPHADENQARLVAMAQTLGMPTYVLVDPRTEEVLAIQENLAWAEDFLAFLRLAP